MEIDWNVAPINGTNQKSFFTRESFERYSVRPSFIGTLDLESSDGGGGQIQASQQNGVRDTSNQKSDTVTGKKGKTEPGGHAEISPKNQATIDKKPAKWMQAKMGLKVLYPRPSSMTRAEQKTYFELSDRFRQLPPLNQEDYRLLSRLKELQVKVAAEQEEYMAYLESVARQFVADYNTVHPVVEKYVSEYLEKRRRNVYRYPRRYILHDTVPVAPSKGQLEVSLTHIRTLLEMGTVAKLILPSMGDSDGGGVTKVPLDYNRISKRYPQGSSETPGTAAGDYTKAPISSDVNVDRLLNKYEADLVMSLGAFQCLIDNYPHNINRQWELAVTVKECDVIVNGTVRKQKVVCLDSPFAPKMITPQEKNLIYRRLALKTLLLHPNHHNVCTLETKLDYFLRSHNQEAGGDCAELIGSENLFADAADDLSSLEVFGTDTQDHSSSKCVISTDLTMSDDDSGTSVSDTTDLPVESATNESQTNDISSASHGVPPMSPIPCLDGLVDEKPAGGEAEEEKRGECSSVGPRRSSRSRRKSTDDDAWGGSTGSGARSNTSTPRRSVRLASRGGKAPESELTTDSDTDDNLFIDCMSPKELNFGPKESSDSAVRLKLPRDNRSMLPDESGDAGRVMCTQHPTKDSASSETVVSCGVFLDTSSNCSAVQSAEGDLKETKIGIESTVPLCSQPRSPEPKEVCERRRTLEESDAKSGSESLVDESCDVRRDTRSSSESTIVDYVQTIEDVKVENPLSSVSSSAGVTAGASTIESTDGKPDEMKSRGSKRRLSVVDALGDLKLDDAVLVPSVSVLPVAKRTRGKAKKVNDVPVNKNISVRDLGGGDGKSLGEMEVRSSTEVSATEPKHESDVASLPTEQTSAKAASERPAPQKSRKRSSAPPPVNKSSPNDTAMPSFSRSSTNDQPLVVQSFLDQILTQQTKMFDRTVVRRQSPQLGPAFAISPTVQTLASSGMPSATIAAGSETRQPVGVLDDRGGVVGCLAGAAKGSTAQPLSAASAEMMCENAGEYVRPSVGNVAYHLWSLGSLKFILRHSHHGIYRPYHPRPPYFMHIQTKLEYQAEHGVEQMTPSEAIRSWTALQLKLRTRLLRAHVNASTSEILLFENLDQNPLLLKANPSASLISVHLLLERLTKLGVGTYLIGHMPGSQHVQVKKTTQAERGVYDLHLAYQSTETLLNQPTSSASYWLPIDLSIRLRYHNKYFRVPCTFEPKDTAMVNTGQQVNFRKNMKKKKKKNS